MRPATSGMTTVATSCNGFPVCLSTWLGTNATLAAPNMATQTHVFSIDASLPIECECDRLPRRGRSGLLVHACPLPDFVGPPNGNLIAFLQRTAIATEYVRSHFEPVAGRRLFRRPLRRSPSDAKDRYNASMTTMPRCSNS